MKNGVFWVVTPCGSCKNRRFGGTWRLLHQGDKIDELGTSQAATSIVPSLPIPVTLMMEAILSSETPVLTRVTQRNILEYTIRHSHRRENFKSLRRTECLSCWNSFQASLSFLFQCKTFRTLSSSCHYILYIFCVSP
jgi:hypothetical protein